MYIAPVNQDIIRLLTLWKLQLTYCSSDSTDLHSLMTSGSVFYGTAIETLSDFDFDYDFPYLCGIKKASTLIPLNPSHPISIQFQRRIESVISVI